MKTLFAEESPFDRFWKAWPSHKRKTSKKRCKARWLKDKLDGEIEHILQVLAAHKKEWAEKKGEFIPMPYTWLHQERYDCDLSDLAQTPESQGPSSMIGSNSENFKAAQDAMRN